MKNICFDSNGWEDYLFWQKKCKKTLARINKLVKEVQREPFCGVGKPEPLRGDFSGFWSRRIDAKNRLVYCVKGDCVIFVQCRYHY